MYRKISIFMWYQILLYRIRSDHVFFVSYCILSYRIASHCIASHHIESHRILSYPIVSFLIGLSHCGRQYSSFVRYQSVKVCYICIALHQGDCRKEHLALKNPVFNPKKYFPIWFQFFFTFLFSYFLMRTLQFKKKHFFF